jgi:diguanylate cyclase (GGDEF)-like protein
MLLDAEQRQLLAKAAFGLRTEKLHRLRFKVGEGVAGWVAQHGEAALIDDVSVDPRFIVIDDARTPIVSMASVPIEARGERVGVVTATSQRRAAFQAHHLELLRFVARTIALDVQNLRLHRVAVTDQLTGAYNREFLQQRLPLEIEKAVIGEAPLSLAMLDVDHFKAINDRWGHDAGDDVLAEVASRLRGAIRGDDLLIRYGGEEFLVVLPRAEAGRAWEVAERMRTRLGARIYEVGGGIQVAASVGIAQLKVEQGAAAETAHELIRRADAALYTAKARGRNRVEVAP